MKKIGKYEFNDSEQANSKIEALGTHTTELGDVVPSHDHSIVRLGYIVLEEAEYNVSGEITKPAVLSDKYHVDVLWSNLEADEDGNYDHPYGWKSYAVDIDNDGVHAFLGLDYNQYKF